MTGQELMMRGAIAQLPAERQAEVFAAQERLYALWRELVAADEEVGGLALALFIFKVAPEVEAMTTGSTTRPTH